eukprot:scaffold4685_cov92-Isochrysis_galbana.AAC.2
MAPSSRASERPLPAHSRPRESRTAMRRRPAPRCAGSGRAAARRAARRTTGHRGHRRQRLAAIARRRPPPSTTPRRPASQATDTSASTMRPERAVSRAQSGRQGSARWGQGAVGAVVVC